MASTNWGNPVAIITVSIQGEGFIMQQSHIMTDYESDTLDLTPNDVASDLIDYLGWNSEFVLITVDPVEKI